MLFYKNITMLFKLVLTLCCWLVAATELGIHESDKEPNLFSIIGGKKSNIKKHPYHVTIVGECSGAIIHKRWILTLASCVVPYYSDIKKYPIRTGSNKQSQGGKLYEVERAVVHTNYSVGNSMYNFALLKTKEPIQFNRNTKKIGYATRKTRTGAKGVLSGWGTTKGDNKTIFFKDVALKKIDFITCQKMYSGNVHVYISMFCAASKDKIQGPCGWDYGDPIVFKGKLHGLFTLYVKCPAKNYPSIFADVTSVVHWIKENISNNKI